MFFFIEKSVSSWSIAWIISFTSFGRLLNCLELFAIIKKPFDKYLFTKLYHQFNTTCEFGFSMSPWKYTRFSNTSGIPIPSNILWLVCSNIYHKKWCLMFWIDKIYSKFKHNSIWDNKGYNLSTDSILLVLPFTLIKNY